MKEKNEERPTARGDKTCSTGQVRRVGWSSVPPQTPRYCSSWRCTLLTFRMGNFCPSYPPTQQQRQTLVLALLQQSPSAGIHPRPRSCKEMLSGYEIGGMSKCQIHRDKLENAIKINVLNSCLMGSDLTTHFYEKSWGKILTGSLEDEGRTRNARNDEISSKTQ